MPDPDDAPTSTSERSGRLMIIGGAEDKLRQRTILRDFVTASGGARRGGR
jgi:cyanophycinase